MMMDIAGWGIAFILVILTILIHYEVILAASDRVLPWALRRFHDRRVMITIMVTLLFGHILEIWVFAGGMWLMMQHPALGHLSGNFDGSFNTLIYFSAVNYSSLGYGDMYPHGALRAVAVSETLCGLLMIAWSASFAYLKMEQIWKLRKGGGNQTDKTG